MNHLDLAAATSAIAMLQGAALAPTDWHPYATNKGFGMIEAYQELASLAASSAHMLLQADQAGLNHPGVYAYEVDAPIGKMYGDMVRNHVDTIEPCDLTPIFRHLQLANRDFFLSDEGNMATLKKCAEDGSPGAQALLKELEGG